MGDRLVVDLAAVRSAAADLEELSSQLTGLPQLAGRARQALGNPQLADRFEDVATNWDVHRKRIVEDLTRFSDWAKQAADAYDGTDAKLAAALTNPPKGGAA